MTKEELRSLTIEQLNGMTEEQLDVIANQVIELFEDQSEKPVARAFIGYMIKQAIINGKVSYNTLASDL